MKHAGAETLKQIAPLLDRIRQVRKIAEKKPGIFYKGAKAFVHFHEDPQGIFADLWVSPDWQRFPVNLPAEQDLFLEAILSALTES
jgi:hypothetical protein